MDDEDESSPLIALCYRAQSLLATAEDPLPEWNAERDRWLAECQARCRALEQERAELWSLCYRAQSLLATAEDPLPAWNAERDRWLADWANARVGLG